MGLAALGANLVLLRTLAGEPAAFAIDYRLDRAAASIGLAHGWSHIYDRSLQQSAIVPLWPMASWPGWWTGPGPFWTPFVSPPPLAWLTAPLNAFPEGVAGWIALAVSAAAFVASALLLARPTWPSRLGYLLLLVLTWATVLAIVSANAVALVALALVIAWRLLEGRREVLAGIVLGLATLKPQVVIALPLLLLASAYWKTTLAWAVTAAGVALVALATLGPSGLKSYLALVKLVSTYPGERHLSLPGETGSEALGIVLGVAACGLFAITAWTLRDRGPAVAFGLGLAASLTVSPYLNSEDFALLPIVTMLVLRLEVAWPVAAIAVALGLSATFASQLFVGPTLLLMALLVLALRAWKPAGA